jgi:hypothetical protein
MVTLLAKKPKDDRCLPFQPKRDSMNGTAISQEAKG